MPSLCVATTVTDAPEDEGTTSAEDTGTGTVTVTTSKDAAPDQSVTVKQTAVTEQSGTGASRAEGPAQPAASDQTDLNGKTTKTTARQTDHGHTTGTTAKTTARTTARTTSRTTARTTARTTSRTTAMATTTRHMITTTQTARTTARTTSPLAYTTPARTARTTVRTTERRVTSQTAATTTAPWLASSASATEQTANPQQTNYTPNTTTANESVGSPDNTGSGGTGTPPPHSSTDTLPVMEVLLPADESVNYYGQTFFAITDGDGFELPEGFAGYAYPDDIDPAEYNVLIVDYYIRCGDAALTEARMNPEDGLTLSVVKLGTNESFCCLRALVFVPKYMYVDASKCTVDMSYAWNDDIFNSYLPDTDGFIPLR